MIIDRKDRFYPRPVTVNGFQYYEVYDCLEHRVLGTNSDWFGALHECYKYRDCDKNNLDPIQLSIPFDF